MKGYEFKRRVRETETGREGYVMTAPVIGATGRVCFGVKFDDGRSQIRNEDTCELIADVAAMREP
jgi:hypothetical protein